VANERAGVLIIRSESLVLIERRKRGRRYWVIPGGGVKSGETIADAATREAEEELGVSVELGNLRVCIDHREEDGSIKRQWYFEAEARDDAIRVVGPEIDNSHRGTYRAVWIGIDEIDVRAVHPSAVAQLVIENRGDWPSEIIEIRET
jgi:8-oxo-dGTP pyrophosphatase MutT (NUDIX family)